MSVQYVCSMCRSPNVSRDAWGIWDTDAQQWVLGDIFDYAYCQDCDAETRLVEQKMTKSAYDGV